MLRELYPSCFGRFRSSDLPVMGRTRFLCATKHEYTFRKSVTKPPKKYSCWLLYFINVKVFFYIVVAVSSRVFFAPLFPKVEYQERASIPWLQPCKGCALPSELSRQRGTNFLEVVCQVVLDSNTTYCSLSCISPTREFCSTFLQLRKKVETRS